MDTNHVTELFPEYLEGILEESQQKKVEAHLKTCPSCAIELEEFKTLLKVMANDKVDVPSERMRTNFHKQLALEKQSQPKVISIEAKPASKKNPWVNNFLKIAASVILLIGSFLLGSYQKEVRSNSEIALLQNEMTQAKKTAMLSLMENKSASRRIQGVNYIDKFSDPDGAIIKALADRMLQDENTNVRLTAVEALSKFAKSEAVKTAFIIALGTEKDPSVQIALIKNLVRIQEEKAIDPMKKLLEQEDTQPFIKNEINHILSQTI